MKQPTLYRIATSALCFALLGASGFAQATHRVTGTLTLMPQKIRLTDVDMVLRDAASQQTVAKASTQLDGKFSLIAPQPGTYIACWKAPGVSGCTGRIVVQQPAVYLGVVQAKPEGRFITGQVLTGDKRACWVNDPFFKLDVATRLSLIDLQGQVVRKDVRANIGGEYAIGGIAPGRYVLQAECEKATTKARVSVGGTSVVSNLSLPNHAPKLAGLAAFDGTQGISRAATGATVKLAATTRDPEQDPVEYLWRTLDGHGTLSGGNAAQQDWKLPGKAGLYTAYLMARDGKGGYAYKRFSLTVGAPDVAFSGRVLDETTGAAVGNASIDVNGKTATTNAQGWFTVAVPPMASPERYVVNISHPQYAHFSRPYDKSVTGDTFELIRAQVGSVNPAQDIIAVDTQSSGPCGQPGGKRTERPITTREQPGRSSTATARTAGIRETACRHIGARITIPAGALVDANRRTPQGNITMAMATLNPARRALPGDYRALDRNGVGAELQSFGAVYAEFRDSNGQLLNLKPGSETEIRIPVAAAQLNQAKPSIAMWSYDEKSGLWKEEGQATLQNTPQGKMYVGKTKHFSTINMDVAGNDPNFATCVRLQLGNSLSGWSGLTLRAYVSYGGTSVQVKECNSA